MARHLGTFAHGILAAYPQPDFLFAAGDDRTDEGLFSVISKASACSLYLQGGKKIPGAADQQRRLQRLQEILDELMSLTDWKKL
jgi:trehalose-6-phosphatase